MNISIVGTGYVGLVTAACLVEKGNKVICIDIDETKIKAISQKNSPIYENGLQELLDSHIGNGLKATTDLHEAIKDSEITVIAVGTPFDGHRIDLSYVSNAAAQIGEILKSINRYHVVVVKSTVVPGTTDEVVLPILEERSNGKAGPDFGVAMNPEFLREGNAVNDFMKPDRIVIGGIDERSIETVMRMYDTFKGTDFVLTNTKTAELIKYAANSFLATTISFSNEIANLSATIPGVDVKKVLYGVHLDKRISPIMDNGRRLLPEITTFLEAGCGFGGSCFPKDVKALISYGMERKVPMRILEAVIDVNTRQPQKLLDLLFKRWPNIRGVRVTVLGLAFKPGTDDVRESPAIPVIQGLIDRGAYVRAFDPKASENARKRFPLDAVKFERDLTEAVKNADAIIIVTAWEEFEKVPQLIQNNIHAPLVIDGRRILNENVFGNYVGIGLGKQGGKTKF